MFFEALGCNSIHCSIIRITSSIVTVIISTILRFFVLLITLLNDYYELSSYFVLTAQGSGLWILNG